MKLALFDCDGTLVDSQHMIVAAMEQAFSGEGIPVPPRAELLGVVGLSLPEAMRRLGDDEPSFPADTLADRYRAAFHELRRRQEIEEPLFPGIRRVIDELSARDDVLLGIATGKSRRGVVSLLDQHGLEGRFVTIQTADDAPSKPHPAMVHRALAESGIQPERTVLIGDTGFDMAMARAAGVRALGVTWGYHSRERLEVAGAELLVSDAAELLPALDRLWKGLPDA